VAHHSTRRLGSRRQVHDEGSTDNLSVGLKQMTEKLTQLAVRAMKKVCSTLTVDRFQKWSSIGALNDELDPDTQDTWSTRLRP